MGKRKTKNLHYAKHLDVTGEKYHMLTAINYVGTDENHAAYWLFRCECGNEKVIALNSVRRKKGFVSSCGCKDILMHHSNPNRLSHGMCGTRLYRIWKAMKTRCTNPNSKDYRNYGGRGITVCNEWKNDFQTFYEWSKIHGYTDDLTIDRIDPNGNYEPSNCRWVSLKIQANNRRSDRYISFNGETHTAKEWEDITGIKSSTIRKRLSLGWDVEKTLTLSVRKGGDVV